MDEADENGTCLLQKRNTTLITTVYQGIPETLILNIITWLILLLLFTILRKKAWDYGRLALVQTVDKWTQLFYGNQEEQTRTEDSETSFDSMLRIDNGCCSWIPALFHVSTVKIEQKCGPDATHYLSFQRQMLWLMALITFISIVIILPINFSGQLVPGYASFGHTTVANLNPKSPLLWIHIILAFCYVPITLYIMSKCSGRIPILKRISKTVMVLNIAEQHRNSSEIFHYFKLLYPDITFKNVELAYDVSRLTVLNEEYKHILNARMHSELFLKRTNKNLKVRPTGCIMCCPWGTENAFEYYCEQESTLLSAVDQERAKALARPLGIAFITVHSAEAADHIVNTFTPGTCRNWFVTHAPPPSDIFWENLSVGTRFWYLKAIFINLFLFIILFFLTTPAIVVNMLDSLYLIRKDFIDKINPLLSEFLPTMLLWTMAALMPVIVAYSDEWLSHWTKSKQNHAVMTKTFVFLVFMIIILPSLGLTSAQAFVEWSLQPHNSTYRWECVFLPDKGAFFVNYVITSAFIGTALELIRFPELFMYVWSLCCAKSTAEDSSIRKAILVEFPFGIHYAWTLVVFTLVMAYSVSCPLITPFGLIYLLLKHQVDRYNLYFAYGPSNMSGDIHVTAIYMIRVAIALLLTNIAAFTVLRGGMDPRAIITIVGLIIVTILLFFFFKICTPVPKTDIDPNQPDPDYVAPVLHPSTLLARPLSPMTLSTQNYGSSAQDSPTSPDESNA